MAIARFGSRDKVPRQRRFTQSGTWVVPGGVTWVKARIVGGGASGACGVGINGQSAIPGSSGGQVIDAILAVTPGSNMTVTVAASASAQLVTAYGEFYAATLGNSSSFGGIVARGGLSPVIQGTSGQNTTITPAPSAGVGSGYGGPTLDITIPAGDGIGFYGAGSGASAGNGVGLGGAGGVPGVNLLIFSSNYLSGIDAPENSGAAGGSIRFANGSSGSPPQIRAGAGGSGIVILDWEEYA